jgi:predicted transcriptional regulator
MDENMKSTMMKVNIILLVSVMLISSSFSVFSQDSSASILIIYSVQEELDYISTQLPNEDIDLTSSLITTLDDKNLLDYDFIIFSSSTEFDISDTGESKLLSYLNTPNKGLFTFSPHVKEFEDALESKLGVQDAEDPVSEEEDNATRWDVRLDTAIGNYSMGALFNYTGPVGPITPTVGSKTILSIISSNSTDQDIQNLDYPLPVVINASTSNAMIITSTLSVIDHNGDGEFENLHLNQLPSIFETLIGELIRTYFQAFQITHLSSSPNTSDPSKTETTENGSPLNLDRIPESDNLIYLMLFFLALLLALTFRKIAGLGRWLIEKSFGLGILVLGAFYNVQDRILDHNDVLINQSRADIYDYLEYIGEHGAHLREIKSILKMGTGSLLWHLQVLEDFEWIIKYKIHNHTIFVATDFIDKFDHELKAIELKLQSKYTIDIIDTLLQGQSETIDISTLEDLTGIHQKTIRRQIKKMYDFKLIDILDEKPLKIVIADEAKIKLISESLWKRREYQPTAPNISINSYH